MNLKRTLSAALLLATMLTAVSCGDAGSGSSAPADTTAAANAETAAESAAETEPHDNVPDGLDFNGYTFRFLTSATTSTNCITVYNEQTGDVLDDVMYERTRWASERFNVNFADDIVPGDSNAAITALRSSITAGDDAFDVSMQLARRAFAMASEGLFLDYAGLPYVDLSAGWYYKDINEQVNLTDAYYVTYGRLNMGILDFMNVLLFNKDLVESYNFDDLYGLVDDGKWTVDRFAEMALTATQDINGDGAMTIDDQYGLVARANTVCNNFLTGFRLRTVEFDSDNVPYLAIDTNQKIYDAYDKIVSLLWDQGLWFTKNKDNNNDYYERTPIFEEGRALFADRSLYSICRLRDMEADFGVVPFPKWDEAQSDYGIMIEAGNRATVIPVTAQNTDCIGAVMEALNFYSDQHVVPTYYEVALKQKYTRDSDSGRMFDLVLDSVFYDLGNTMLCETVKDGIFRIFQSGNKDLASSVAKNANLVQNAIDTARGLS